MNAPAKVWAIVLAVLCFAAAGRAQGSQKNGVLEGIQLSSEQGADYGEKIVTAYFIFRDNPSNMFYEIKRKPNRAIFEFFDAVKGSAPLSEITEAPVRNFTVVEKQVNMNKEVKGLRPDMHDVLQVTFYLDHIPRINVSEEYGIYSFSYKWTDFPTKINKYVMKDGKGGIVLWSLAGISAIGGGVAAYILTQPSGEIDSVPQPISVDDLPPRPDF